MDACDPDVDLDNLGKLIRLHTALNVKLTKDEMCEAFQEIQNGKLPLPLLILNGNRTYLIDKKSPLKVNDYDLLFDSTTKRDDLRRVARKVNIKKTEQMTKSQIVNAIGNRLRYMKIREPVKLTI